MHSSPCGLIDQLPCPRNPSSRGPHTSPLTHITASASAPFRHGDVPESLSPLHAAAGGETEGEHAHRHLSHLRRGPKAPRGGKSHRRMDICSQAAVSTCWGTGVVASCLAWPQSWHLCHSTLEEEAAGPGTQLLSPEHMAHIWGCGLGPGSHSRGLRPLLLKRQWFCSDFSGAPLLTALSETGGSLSPPCRNQHSPLGVGERGPSRAQTGRREGRSLGPPDSPALLLRAGLPWCSEHLSPMKDPPPMTDSSF